MLELSIPGRTAALMCFISPAWTESGAGATGGNGPKQCNSALHEARSAELSWIQALPGFPDSCMQLHTPRHAASVDIDQAACIAVHARLQMLSCILAVSSCRRIANNLLIRSQESGAKRAAMQYTQPNPHCVCRRILGRCYQNDHLPSECAYGADRGSESHRPSTACCRPAR